MYFFDIYPIILSVVLVFLLGWLIPKKGNGFDLLQVRLDLFPRWFKLASTIWALIAAVLVVFIFRATEGVEYFLVGNLNIALFLFYFSKEKNEDEYSEQLRLKAFFYSFISFVGVLIIVGALEGSNLSVPSFLGEHIFVQLLLGVALISALSYFHFTLYKSSKENS